MLENLTVILFTRNRFEKASVVIRFWLNRGAQVLLLDASSQIELKQQFGAKTNLVYFRAESFWERALFASKNICTKYALIHSDDSLVIPNVVKKAIAVLEKNEQLGFLYAPGNFSSWWYEDSSREYPKQMGGKDAYKRMFQWASNPNDLMWGAIWRSVQLEKALKIWGKSTSVIPFETNLHTTSLYLAGAALTSGKSINGPMHLSRHWLAPKDETFEKVRSLKSPLGIDLNLHENNQIFSLWKTKLLDGINEELEPTERITLGNLVSLLELYEKKEPNLGRKFYGNISFQQRVREKILILLIQSVEKKSGGVPFAKFILKIFRQVKLSVNYMKRVRLGWYRSNAIGDFTNYEIVQYGIRIEKYSELNLKNYSRLFTE